MQGDKNQRQQTILNLLNSQILSNQEELRNELIKRGFQVTQATLSRDLKELGVIKNLTREGLYKYTVRASAPNVSVLSGQASGNLIVLRTQPGMAPAVAYKVDAIKSPEILGTVAGEDTVLVVVSEKCDTKEMRDEIWERLRQE